MNRKHDQTLGALGARWGGRSEAFFRNALRSILEESFSVKVERIKVRDEKGVVFGYSELLELDVIIHNGCLIICEIKSSTSKSEMYTFQKKVELYEKKRRKKASRKMVISPMVTHAAMKIAKKFKIEVHSYADAVKA